MDYLKPVLHHRGNLVSYLDCDYRISIVFLDAPWLFLTLYIVYISSYVIWTDISENKLFVIVIVIVIVTSMWQRCYWIECIPVIICLALKSLLAWSVAWNVLSWSRSRGYGFKPRLGLAWGWVYIVLLVLHWTHTKGIIKFKKLNVVNTYLSGFLSEKSLFSIKVS